MSNHFEGGRQNRMCGNIIWLDGDKAYVVNHHWSESGGRLALTAKVGSDYLVKRETEITQHHVPCRYSIFVGGRLWKR
jgi:hypothetical protein